MSFKVLDFYADWCQPCKVVSKEIDSLEEEYSKYITKVNIEEDDENPSKYYVRNIPTLVFILNGNEVYRHIGTVTAARLIDLIDRYKKEITPKI